MFHVVPGLVFMKEQLRKEWTTLMQEGVHGQAARFRLRALRLAQLLSKVDPELSATLVSGVSEASSLTRLAPGGAGTDVPDLLEVTTVEMLPVSPLFPPQVVLPLRQVVAEWEGRDVLLRENLQPVHTVLLHGPPGVGKTLAAHWLAHELQLPLATLNLAATMNSYLGKTGQNITRVLEYARSNACVLFLDEFDALGKRRSDENDVGELKRIVNVLLQAIDQWRGPSLLIAATNHESLLDEAMVRRFELSIAFPQATTAQLGAIFRSLGVSRELASKLAPKFVGQPISNATRLVTGARKRAVLEGVPFERILEVAASDYAPLSPVAERRSKVRALTDAGHSAHQIAKDLAVSHTTVLRDLKALTGGKDEYSATQLAYRSG